MQVFPKMKKLTLLFLFLTTVASYAQVYKIDVPGDISRFAVPSSEVKKQKAKMFSSMFRGANQLELYIDYPVASELELGGSGNDTKNFLWTFNSAYDSSDVNLPINYIAVRNHILIGYQDPDSDPLNSYVGPLLYPSDLEIRIDSVYMLLAHENNSGEENKIYVDILPLDSTGLFRSYTNALKTDSFVTSSNISPNGWLQQGNSQVVKIPVGYHSKFDPTIDPDDVPRLAISVRYVAPKTDSLGMLAGYLPTQSTYGLPQSDQIARRSAFPTSVVRIAGQLGNNITLNRGLYQGVTAFGDTNWWKAQDWHIWAKVTIGDPSITVLATEPVSRFVSLGSNYPNPFTDYSTIRYTVNEVSDVKLVVYNISGQVVSVNELGRKTPGVHTSRLSSDGLNAGTYMYRLEGTGGNTAMNKMVVVK